MEEEILKSILLEYDRSTFLVDLLKHSTGVKYISIQQSIEANKNTSSSQKIKINPAILGDIISILKSYQSEIDKSTVVEREAYFSPEKQKAVVERYLKGVNIPDLEMQFDCSSKIIKQILSNKNIEIVDNSLPKYSRYRFRFGKKK
jgi:hypothetical protein